MAGEWIKFEASTPEKREVFSITAAMGWDDPDMTVGKLLKVWRWFDQQTVSGNADGVTLPLLDRIIGVSGFAQAMVNVGWLEANDAGLSLPNFDRHNGKTAKDRALTAKRVAKHKTNVKGNGASVTAPLPKEEKRREDKNQVADADAPDDDVPSAEDEEFTDRRKKPRTVDEDFDVARWLYDCAKEFNPTAKKPNFQTWAEDVRLMRERDGRSHKEICSLFRWAKGNSFWGPNIQSPSKLREKWDQLAERRARDEPPAAPVKKDWI